MKMQKSTGALLMMLGLLMEVLSCAAYGQTTLYPTNGVPESFSTDPFSIHSVNSNSACFRKNAAVFAQLGTQHAQRFMTPCIIIVGRGATTTCYGDRTFK